ncbi:MAG: hypothetical protein KY428_08425 [Bacteroidetes bacterium]|nr:hypothetical protein [Bacteroidota bacterium]
MDKTEVTEALELLQKHGVLDPQPQEANPDFTLEELHALLTKQVLYLLERDMERLLQAMYRIDVAEQKFKEALVSEDPASELARLILQREMMKVHTRRWYASRSKSAIDEA